MAAWVGFTLPSALALVTFAYGLRAVGVADTGWLHGLKVAAEAVVAQAVRGMASTLAPDRDRATIALPAAIVVLAWPTALTQVLVIAAAGLAGRRVLAAGGAPPVPPALPLRAPISRRAALAAWIVFFALLAGLPLARQLFPGQALAVFDSFFRVGSLVFGGGHVVLPLLQGEVVPPGWVTSEQFVAGYSAAQAVPGPLFTSSAYPGAVTRPAPGGRAGAGLALAAIFLPSFLLVVGALPFWDALRARVSFRAALLGINAAVVGLLLAGLYHPVWTSAVHGTADFILAPAVFGPLALWRLPPWLAVVFSAAAAAVLA